MKDHARVNFGCGGCGGKFGEMLEERIVVGIFVAVVSPSLIMVLKSLWFLMHDTSHCPQCRGQEGMFFLRRVCETSRMLPLKWIK